jgi:hypothetical protein
MSGVTLSSWVIWALTLLPWFPCVEGMRESRISELRYVVAPVPPYDVLLQPWSHLVYHISRPPLLLKELPWFCNIRAYGYLSVVPVLSFSRRETEHMFYHGFENYMNHAFPEDELRPISCRPLTRDRENAAHVELNDVLGNYSLTLVDSLSTLAILSSLNSSAREDRKAWNYFQNGVKDLVKLYGDGSNGPAGKGLRGKGFEVDSKVQVFETVIRGLGEAYHSL